MTAATQKPRPKDIFPGQRWVFVDSNVGKRTEYVVVDPADETQMAPDVRRQLAPGAGAMWEGLNHAHSIVYLLNELTGKYAMVTRYWLYGMAKSSTGASYWEVADAA